MRTLVAIAALLPLALPAAAEPAGPPVPIASREYWLGVLRCSSQPTADLRASCEAGAARLRDSAARMLARGAT